MDGMIVLAAVLAIVLSNASLWALAIVLSAVMSASESDE